MASGYNDPEKLKAALELARSFKSSRASDQQRGRKDARATRGHVTTMGSFCEPTPRTASRSNGPPPISQRQYRDAGSFAPKANTSGSSQPVLGGAAMAFLRRHDEKASEHAPRTAPTIFPRLKTSADQAEAPGSQPAASPATTHAAAQHKPQSVESGQTGVSSNPLANENNAGYVTEGRNDHSQGSKPTTNAAVVHPKETVQDTGKLAAPSASSFMEIFRAVAPPGVFPESPKKDELLDLGSPEKEHSTLDAQPGTVPLSSTSSGTANDTSPQNTESLPRLPAPTFDETKPQDKPRLRPQAKEYIPASQHPPEALHQSGHRALAQTGRPQGQFFAQPPVAMTQTGETQVGVPPGETTVFRHHSSWENGVIMSDSSSTAATKGHQPPVNRGTDNANSCPSKAQTNSSNGVKTVKVKKGLRDSRWA